MGDKADRWGTLGGVFKLTNIKRRAHLLYLQFGGYPPQSLNLGRLTRFFYRTVFFFQRLLFLNFPYKLKVAYLSHFSASILHMYFERGRDFFTKILEQLKKRGALLF